MERTTTSDASIASQRYSFRSTVSCHHSLILCDQVFELHYPPYISCPSLHFCSQRVSSEAPRQDRAVYHSIISCIPSSGRVLISSSSLPSLILTYIPIQSDQTAYVRSSIFIRLLCDNRPIRQPTTFTSSTDKHHLINNYNNRSRINTPIGEWNCPIFYLAQYLHTNKISFTKLLHLLARTPTRPEPR